MSQAYPFPQEAPPEAIKTSGPPQPNASQFLDLYQQTVLQVYRFQLIRTGEVDKGQALTSATFHAALSRADDLPAGQHERAVWLFRTALRLLNQSERGSRLASAIYRPSGDLAHDYPAQTDLTWRARIFNLAHGLNQLPAAQANALALHFFAGLSVAETATVLNRTPATVTRLVEQGLVQWFAGKPESQAVVDEIVHTAEQTQPEGEFISTLEAELRFARPAAARPTLRNRLARANPPHPAVLGLVLVLVLLTAVLRFPQIGGQASSLFRNLLPEPAPELPSKPGSLTPPEPAVCREWQHTLSQALDRQVKLDLEAPFTDPMLDSPGANGSGCMLTATGTGLSFESLDSTLVRLSPLLEDMGFSFNGMFYDNTGSPDGTLVPGDWFGRALLWQRPGERAILMVTWRPADQLRCPYDPAENACGLLPEQKLFTVRLALAAAPETAVPREVALLAGKDGAIYRAALSSQDGRVLYPLTGPDFYHPGFQSNGTQQAAVPRLSPDGAWLLLPQAESSGTWLLSLPEPLNEPAQARRISTEPLNGAWSPDSHRLAYLLPDEPQNLFLLDPAGGKPGILASFPEAILSIAYSPDGSHIAAAYASPNQQAIYYQPDPPFEIYYTLVNVEDGTVEALASVTGRASYVGPRPLLWTEDGSEIWSLLDPSNPIAIEVASGEARPVVADPGAWLTPERFTNYAMRWRVPEVSPDGQRVARLRRSRTDSSERRVAIYRMGNGLQFESSYDINASVMAWGADSRSLVAASNWHNPGEVWWVDLEHTPQLISQDMALIGLVSNMQRSSLLRADASPKTAMAVPDGDWQQIESDELGISASFPEGWRSALEVNDGETRLTLTNLEFAQDGGWASLGPEALYVEIERYSMDPGLRERSQDYLMRNPAIWRPVMVGSEQGFRLERSENSGEPQRVYVPLPDKSAYLVISKYPYASDQDAVFSQILSRIQFLQ